MKVLDEKETKVLERNSLIFSPRFLVTFLTISLRLLLHTFPVKYKALD